ncbi:hypothetical protein BV898_05083 [Hypsibius exemplaris]|uniref:Uncharacterized protein n=1 Tax=Hypsibius exemplaris TaxID=2072580 RepID=A0A1W0X0K2_HYPEX|nr:hypothetical protein BV898_05083 [Hypsibius exemplaris]
MDLYALPVPAGLDPTGRRDGEKCSCITEWCLSTVPGCACRHHLSLARVRDTAAGSSGVLLPRTMDGLMAGGPRRPAGVEEEDVIEETCLPLHNLEEISALAHSRR